MIEGLLLPRGYLSWSAFYCWKTNPKRFVQEYFEKSSKLDTKYLRFGKGIAKMIEDGLHKEILPDLPLYKVHEHEIRAEVRGVPILSFLDGDNNDEEEFGEYKTGKRGKDGKPPWNRAKVQKHDQLTFYAVGKRAETGRMPKRCFLHWIETEENAIDENDFWSKVDKKLAVTGIIVTFERVFDERELDRMETEIVKVALQISAAYKAWIAEI